MLSLRKQRKLRNERMKELELRKLRAEKIKDLFGKPSYKTRSQLYNLVKDKPDYKQQLDMMKNIFKTKGGKNHGKTKFL